MALTRKDMTSPFSQENFVFLLNYQQIINNKVSLHKHRLIKGQPTHLPFIIEFVNRSVYTHLIYFYVRDTKDKLSLQPCCQVQDFGMTGKKWTLPCGKLKRNQEIILGLCDIKLFQNAHVRILGIILIMEILNDKVSMSSFYCDQQCNAMSSPIPLSSSRSSRTITKYISGSTEK